MAATKQATTVQPASKGVIASARTTAVQGFEVVQMAMSIAHRGFSLADAELKNLQTMQAVRMVSEQAELKIKCEKLGIDMPQF